MKWDPEKYNAVSRPEIEAGMKLISLARVKGNDAVLDIGCGTGTLTAEMGMVSGGEVIGIDPSEEMLEAAKDRLSGMTHVSLLPLTVQSLSFTNRFDMIYANSSLHWAPDQEKAIDILRGALKVGGRLAVQMPAANFCKEYFENIDRSIYLLGLSKKYASWKLPWFLPTEEQYRELLVKADLCNIRVSYSDTRVTFPSLREMLDWWIYSGYLPQLELLDERESECFQYVFAMHFEKMRTKEGIAVDFRRLFATAEK